MNKISLDEKFSLFDEHWRPKTIAALNGQEVKIVRVEFRDRVVLLEPGECVLVPRGIEHRTCADDEACILCFEPAGTVNTGNIHDKIYTAPGGVAI